jgi:hypothetical protein
MRINIAQEIRTLHFSEHYVRFLVSSFILFSVLRQFRSLFQSEFSIECDLVLPVSISSIFSFPWGEYLKKK